MMLKTMIETAIRFKRVTLFTAAAAVLVGGYCFYRTPKQEFPEVTAPVAMLSTIYPGASPQEVEQLITGPIEDILPLLPGYASSQSFSSNSNTIVIVWLDIEADVDKAWEKLRYEISNLNGRLPEGCADIQINTEMAKTTGFIYSLTGPSYSNQELVEEAEKLKNRLLKTDGIINAQVLGESIQDVVINVDIHKLNAINLSLDDVCNILKLQNVNLPAGSLRDGQTTADVKINPVYSSIKDIKNTPLGIQGLQPIRIRDIANVEEATKPNITAYQYNGQDTVLVAGWYRENEDIVRIGKLVKNNLREYHNSLPSGMTVSELLIQADEVSASINGFLTSLLTGVLLVIVVILIGMGFRNALVVSTAIPLSILLTICGMSLLRVEIQQISIAGLIISLGMLVDNAIVITDSIQVKLDNGFDGYKACLEGTTEVAIPVLTSTLTTIAAFLPLMFLPGVAGQYVYSLPLIVIMALAASYITAVLFVPVMAFITFKEGKRVKKEHRSIFSKRIHGLIKRPGVVLSIALLFFLLSMWMTSQLGLQFFPKADKSLMYIDIHNKPSNDELEDIMNKVQTVLDKQPEVIAYTSAKKGGLPKFYITIPVSFNNPNSAQVLIQLDLASGNRFKTNRELVEHLQTAFDEIRGDTKINVKELELAEPLGAPIRIRITGDNFTTLQSYAKEIKDAVKSVPGTIRVTDDTEEEVVRFAMDIDCDNALLMGLTRFDIQRDVSIALGGKTATILRSKGMDRNVIVKGDIECRENLLALSVKSSISGGKVPLEQVASLTHTRSTPLIKHYGGRKSITIYSDVAQGHNVVTVENQIRRALGNTSKKGISLVFDGEQSKIRQYFGNAAVAAIFAALLIYGILLIQFNSLKQPLVILLTVPLAATGSILGIYLLRQPLSFMAILGMVSLLGIVVNNAIILVDFINKRRRENDNIHQACSRAVSQRFRPILLTTVTTFTGLIPLALSGSQLFLPLSISLMSGLAVSALLTLVVIPAAYILAERKQ